MSKTHRTSKGRWGNSAPISREIVRKQQAEILQLSGESWLGRIVYRPISVWLTPLLMRTPVTPNTLTVLSHLFGIAWVVLWCFPYIWSILLGFLGFNMWLLFDVLDGDLARAKNKCSLKGVYLDTLGHHIVNPALFSAISLQIYHAGGGGIYLYLVLPAYVIGLFPKILSDSRALLILEQKCGGRESRHRVDSLKEDISNKGSGRLNPKISRLASVVRKIEDIATLSLLFFGGCLIEILIGGILIRSVLFFMIIFGLFLLIVIRGVRYFLAFR